ncbi:uncharacterized protein LOC116846167 isoform X2 [Odontomachus brunneus]|nr:uncharacterized protein LOC116846167 isoform X2 [Odontomachus brunneus]
MLAKCDFTKAELTDAIEYFRDVLIQFDIINNKASKTFSNNAKLIGGKLFEKFLKLLGQHAISEEVEYYIAEGQDDVAKEDATNDNDNDNDNDTTPEGDATPANKPHTSQSVEEDYEPPRKVTAIDPVPYEEKLKIVLFANEHPHWSFRSLQKRFKKHLRNNCDLARFRNYILSGGTFWDKMKIIKRNVYDRFTEARKQKQLVTRRLLQQWAMTEAVQYNGKGTKSAKDGNAFRFVASNSWLTSFIREYKISSRRVVRYISKKEIVSPESVMESTIHFQYLIKAMLPDYDPDFIINSDQMDCEYRINVTRTYTHTGEKLVQLYIGDLNKISHTYTVQYSLTKSGKLLNKVFVCLQEYSDSFGVRVQKEIDTLLQLCKNVVVVCSKFGKLTTHLYQQYLKLVVKPYVGNNKFLFLVDAWGGQKNIQTYNEIFRDDDNKPTCNLQIIPSKCTPICHPCDVYFYRQVEILIKQIHDCSFLFASSKSINLDTRADAIRIQSLTHYILSAPVFKFMLQYAWYASNLVENRNIFHNVNQICFPLNIHNQRCICAQNNAFIACSWCKNLLCFPCFYIAFHPQHCDKMTETYNV